MDKGMSCKGWRNVEPARGGVVGMAACDPGKEELGAFEDTSKGRIVITERIERDEGGARSSPRTLLKIVGIERDEIEDGARTLLKASLVKRRGMRVEDGNSAWTPSVKIAGAEREEGRCRRDPVTSNLLARLSLEFSAEIEGNEPKGIDVGDELGVEDTKDVIGIDTPSIPGSE